MSLKKYIFIVVLTLCLLKLYLAQDNWNVRRQFPHRNIQKMGYLNCSTKFTNEVIQLIIDYIKWRNIIMLYVIDGTISTGCSMKALRRCLYCFNSNGISVALQRKFSKKNFYYKAKRVLVVSFLTPDMDYDIYLEQINLLSTTGGYYSWLNIYKGYNESTMTDNHALEILGSSGMNLAADMVIALEMPRSPSTEIPNQVMCRRKNQIFSVSLEKQNVAAYLPFDKNKSNNSSEMYFKDYCNESIQIIDVSYCILQVYKVRSSENSSIVILPLGFWDYEIGTKKMKPFQSVETRIDFRGFPVIFGKKKFTLEAQVPDENLIEDDNDVENMDKIQDYITDFLNAEAKVKMYPTLGFKQANGNWSGLLGAVMQQEVDLGLDSVIKVPERYNDMPFTQNIMLSIRNIYLKPEESHSARDIFLQPFKSQLLLCVLCTGVIFATVMSIYILIIRKISSTKDSTSPSYLAVSDAVLWSCSVISMQGSPVQPKSYSGNLIVVTSLLFALIIYNSYSAFITSILSVKLTEIQSVDDLLKSDYDIGYTKNSQDEIYLRSMNNVSQLNQIYLRGYLHNNINNITQGLLKATKGGYGFFATGHIARKEILKISGYKCKFDIKEIPVKSTENSVGFPMSLHSPYRKVINMCLIRLFESGIHDYIDLLIEPNLPECEKQKTYQSARITDLTTCFILLAMGLLAAIIVVILECFWKKKKMVYFKLKNQQRALNRNMPWIQ